MEESKRYVGSVRSSGDRPRAGRGVLPAGGRKLFQPTFTFDTYFDESVAGLDSARW